VTLEELQKQALSQIGGDQEDMGDAEPGLTRYLNEGYDRLLFAMNGMHVSDDGAFLPLRHGRAEPELPQWAHPAIADFASWRLCMGGPLARQARGAAFRQSFEQAESRLRLNPGAYFRGIPL